MTKKKLTFEEWIDLKGPIEIAKLLGVGVATIRHWRANRCDPRVEQMRRIKKITRGALTYEQMIDRPKQATR